MKAVQTILFFFFILVIPKAELKALRLVLYNLNHSTSPFLLQLFLSHYARLAWILLFVLPSVDGMTGSHKHVQP
jgi:hypothetical protein